MKFDSVLNTAASAIAIGAAFVAMPAFAQSTGSVDFEGEIVVTGVGSNDVQGVTLPDSAKSKQILTQEFIQRQNPGQTILDTINVIPGVVFTNNDAYGSSGGQLTIRGFSQDRISLTFDGIPLNDSGNYEVYSNQQLDPELIEQVNVNLGTTDVDSPTAAATGSTVNYRTRNPSEDFGAMFSGSAGEFNFFRMFGMVDTGVFTPFGTRAFFSASHAENDNPFNNYGRVDKEQYNGKIYQPIGSNGDFVSLAAHYNVNRTNFFGSLPLRFDRDVPSGFPATTDDREYDVLYPCSVADSTFVGTPGVADTPNTCGTEFDRRYNPSDTGNIRMASRFSLTDALTLTVDPSFQWVKANGGGTVGARERTSGGLAGYIGGRPYFGMDLNGDGDTLDEITMVAPSQTRTRRVGVISNLSWEINEDHSVRVSYTYDRARHRQTGEVGLLRSNGEPESVFPIDDPLADVTGAVLQKRDRLSFATLHQVSGEYRGSFMNDALILTAGVRAPFFKRDLNNFCFTTSATGFVDCFGKDDPRNAIYGAANPTVQGPQQRVLKYDDILPNLGFVFNAAPAFSVFGNYSKGLQVPGTDALYNAFFFPANTASAKPEPETTDNFDLGVRYRTSKLQAQASVWYTKYQNRLASAYDPETERNLYRNLGAVEKYGVDGSIDYAPISGLTMRVFGSYLKSKIKDNVLAGVCTQGNVDGDQLGCTTVGEDAFYQTAGKREAGAPAFTYGGMATAQVGLVSVSMTAKRTGGRYIYDTNEPIVASGVEIYPARTNAYWLVNLDARLSLEAIGLNEKSYFQLNVYNLTDELYVGRYTNGISPASSPPFAQIGAPRTVSGTVVFAF